MPSINKKSHQNHFLEVLEIIGGRLLEFKHDWVPIKVYPTIFDIDSTTSRANWARCSLRIGSEENKAFKRLEDSITNNDTMAYFDLKKPIVVQTEASFHE